MGHLKSNYWVLFVLKQPWRVGIIASNLETEKT